jgi:dihydrodipicolinate synthase/N-acetylneuraminate lyase
MRKAHFAGIIPPLVTPFDDRGSYAGEAMERLLDRVIGGGVHGVFLLGSTGEFAEMDAVMRKAILAHCIAYVKGRVPVFVGIGASSTRETIELGHHAEEVGADAALVVNDFYSPLSREKLAGFYRDVAASIDLPLFLYNNPAMTGQDLEPSLVRELALSCENIVGIKDTVDAPAHTRQIILDVHAERPDFMVFAGHDDQMLGALILGGHGGIAGTANFAPEIACALYRAFQQRDYPATIARQRQISALVAIYGVDIPSYGAVKAAIRMTGVDIPASVLPPARPLEAQGVARISAILNSAGIRQIQPAPVH